VLTQITIIGYYLL